MTETEQTDSLHNTLSALANALIKGFNDAISGPITLTIGQYVHVQHPTTSGFRGHIAALPTKETVVVARESDGVLVHVRRECIMGVDDA